MDHTRVVKVERGEASRSLVEVEYSDDGVLTGAHLTHVSLAHVSAAELERITAASATLRNQRVRQTQARAEGWQEREVSLWRAEQ